MNTEEELDYLETFIPSLAENATNKAYVDALVSGKSVVEIIDGEIVLTAPNGTHKLIKKAKPVHKVPHND